jgi:hypothetical protein
VGAGRIEIGAFDRALFGGSFQNQVLGALARPVFETLMKGEDRRSVTGRAKGRR